MKTAIIKRSWRVRFLDSPAIDGGVRVHLNPVCAGWGDGECLRAASTGDTKRWNCAMAIPSAI